LGWCDWGVMGSGMGGFYDYFYIAKENQTC